MLVLHIGRHKCGSTSLQHFLQCNTETLRNFGIVYPRTGRDRHAHHQLSDRMRRDDFADFDAIVADAAAHPENHVVVSSEGLCLLAPPQIAELRRRAGGQHVIVVLYIKELAAWIPSKYNEFTKRGNNLLDFDGFYARQDLSSGLKLLHRAEQWAQSFGWENIRVRSLDKRSLARGTLLDDFLSVFDLSLADFGGADAPGLAPQNVSHGWKVLEVLRARFGDLALNPETHELRNGRPCFHPKVTSDLRKSVVHAMTELNLGSERTQYISARQWAQCNDAYAREVERLNRKLVGPKIPIPELRAITERPFLPSIEEIPAAQRREIAERLHSGTGRRGLAANVVARVRRAMA